MAWALRSLNEVSIYSPLYLSYSRGGGGLQEGSLNWLCYKGIVKESRILVRMRG
jgi:hypothetical protein